MGIPAWQITTVEEITYPLGSEVYRDENGSVFVVPNLPQLLDCTDPSDHPLRELISQEFARGTLRNNSSLQLGGEITPSVELEETPWWGQDPDWKAKIQTSGTPLFGQPLQDELPAIGSALFQRVVSQPRVDGIESFWRNREVADICTVCGLRPQGPSTKTATRNVCDVCEERRGDRSKEWATTQSDQTIWTDEVGDVNGRLALIVGQFDLTHWLDGSLVESLLLIAPHDPENTAGKPVTSKTPSFSRLRRIWETTRRFWQEVQADALPQLTDDRRRLKIYLNGMPDLGPFHVYDLELDATILSVVWYAPQPNRSGGYLISADNLGYIARQLGAEASLYSSPATAAIFVEDYMREHFVQKGHQPILHNPDVQASQSNPNLLTGLQIVRIDFQDDKYATATPILAEPRTLMLLVPADKSLEVLRLLKEKYDREMSKVHDRLPIHVGLVYAYRRTPIPAVLEAGRHMLMRRTLQSLWKVASVSKQLGVPPKKHALTRATKQFDETIVLKLARDVHWLDWYIPAKIGDGTTDDRWYPYVFLETGGDDSQADDKNRRAVKVSRPRGNGQVEPCWIVHTADLHPGEEVHFSPSTFDFEFLDTTARRFEIYYDSDGRRPRRTRPFYLEDVDRLDELWNLLKRLAVSQRHQVVHTIEATREAWYGPRDNAQAEDDHVFKQFVADTLAGAAWPKDLPWHGMPQEWRDQIIQAGVSGELADVMELRMEILKER